MQEGALPACSTPEVSLQGLEAGFTMLSAMAFHSDSSSFPDFSFLEAPLSITVPSCGFQTIETVIEIISNDRSEYVYSIKYF